MEPCSAFDGFGLSGQRRASLADDCIEFLDGFDVLVVTGANSRAAGESKS